MEKEDMGTRRIRTQNLAFLLSTAAIVMVIPSLVLAARWSYEDPTAFPGVWYRIAFDNNGDQTVGDGDGQGWYYYPASGRYRMWFHNGAYDAGRKARLDYHVYLEAIDPERMVFAVVRFLWTTPEWSQAGHSSPPYPDDVPTLNDESDALSGADIMTIDNWFLGEGSREAENIHVVEDYNPEWVGIEIEGRNAYIFRGAFHECLPREGSSLGACCNRKTGQCYLTTESECEAPYEWLGAGSSCASCVASGASSLDFGDAPDPRYPTLLASNGARHTIVPGLFLGRSVDAEPDGQPNVTATGDDVNGADEDGVVFTSALQPGNVASVEVTASAQGYLNAWIDFDADGSFAGPGERIFFDEPLKAGDNRLTFFVPADAVWGPTYARFRLNSRGVLDHDGPAADGEVEDYRVEIARDYEPHATSGLTAMVWDQPPSGPNAAQPYSFEAGSVLSALHLHQLVADDWQAPDDRPITGIHWWGTFDGWTESALPPQTPLAFHLGIWTNAPDPEPLDFETFAHPDTLIWETYCTSWVWALAGYERGDRDQPGETCFQFTCLLSQDQWFHGDPPVAPNEQAQGAVYWLSITAVYDLKGTKPTHVWAWKTRPGGPTAAGTAIERVSVPESTPAWPPIVGACWQEGQPLRDRDFLPVDTAFQLTTYVPLGYERPVPAGP
jgi:hypothetical protein